MRFRHNQKGLSSFCGSVCCLCFLAFLWLFLLLFFSVLLCASFLFVAFFGVVLKGNRKEDHVRGRILTPHHRFRGEHSPVGLGFFRVLGWKIRIPEIVGVHAYKKRGSGFPWQGEFDNGGFNRVPWIHFDQATDQGFHTHRVIFGCIPSALVRRPCCGLGRHRVSSTGGTWKKLNRPDFDRLQGPCLNIS